jgi:uncharacterized protein (TIGR02246 family)
MSPEKEVLSFNSSFPAALANSDADAMLSHFAPDVRWIAPGAPMIEGRHDLRDHFVKIFQSGMRLKVKSYATKEVLDAGPLVVEIFTEVVGAQLPGGAES